MRNWVIGMLLGLSSSVLVAADAPVRRAQDEPVRQAQDAPYGVPNDEACAKALKLIQTTFKDEYAGAVNLPQRSALAARLYREAMETRDDSVARYVLLCEARELASKAGDATVAIRAIDQLAKQYGVAPVEMTLAALSTAARFAVSVQSQEVLARAALASADQALLRDEYELAGRLAAVADVTAQKTKKIVLISEAADKVKEIGWAAREFEAARVAMDRLSSKPNDADAKSAAGRFKCLVKGDWERGLPMLLDGSDVTYRTLAEKDLAAATSDEQIQLQAGHQWWELGERLPARARICCRARAIYWYRKAAAKLTGLSRTSAEKRIEEVETARMREMHLEQGLVAEIFAGETFEKLLKKRVDANIDFDWPAEPGEDLPKDNFCVRWTGHLRVPESGTYALTLIVNKGGRVFIDDRLVMDVADGTMKRKGVKESVTLESGMRAIKVEFSDSGGIARVRLLWTPPGAQAEEVIGAKAFYHEKGSER